MQSISRSCSSLQCPSFHAVLEAIHKLLIVRIKIWPSRSAPHRQFFPCEAAHNSCKFTTPSKTLLQALPGLPNHHQGIFGLEKNIACRPHLFISHCTDSAVSPWCCKGRFKGKDKQWRLTRDSRVQRVCTLSLQHKVTLQALWKQGFCPASMTAGEGQEQKTDDTEMELGTLPINNRFFLALPSWVWFREAGFGGLGIFVWGFFLFGCVFFYHEIRRRQAISSISPWGKSQPFHMKQPWVLSAGVQPQQWNSKVHREFGHLPLHTHQLSASSQR